MTSEVISEPDGPRFGPYILTAVLGRGGMGVVYRAFDTVKGRTVALKVLIPQLAADRAFQDRFRRESKRAARLSEPHIIPIHDYGQIDGRLFIDMRLVDGIDLATLLDRDGPMPPPAAAWITAQVAQALDAAHADGLIHRDVKPSNVLITGHGKSMPFAYLIDFGIARVITGTSLTTNSGTVGTVAYMAPERFAGSPGDCHADVYSLACVLYECLTGHAPFTGEMVAVMWAQLNTVPPAPSTLRPGLPAVVDDVVARGLAKDPAQRYGSAGELAEAILAATADPGVVSHPVSDPVRDQPYPARCGPRRRSRCGTATPAGRPGPRCAPSSPIRTWAWPPCPACSPCRPRCGPCCPAGRGRPRCLSPRPRRAWRRRSAITWHAAWNPPRYVTRWPGPSPGTPASGPPLASGRSTNWPPCSAWTRPEPGPAGRQPRVESHYLVLLG